MREVQTFIGKSKAKVVLGKFIVDPKMVRVASLGGFA